MNCGSHPNTFRDQLRRKVFSSPNKPIVYTMDKRGIVCIDNRKDIQIEKKYTLLEELNEIKRLSYYFNTEYYNNGYIDTKYYFNELKKQKYLNTFKHK